jgi:hypothetical protein
MVDWMLEKNPDNRPEVATILQMPQMQREVSPLHNRSALKNKECVRTTRNCGTVTSP